MRDDDLNSFEPLSLAAMRVLLTIANAGLPGPAVASEIEKRIDEREGEDGPRDGGRRGNRKSQQNRCYKIAGRRFDRAHQIKSLRL